MVVLVVLSCSRCCFDHVLWCAVVCRLVLFVSAGASLEANIRAMHTLAGFCPQDVLLAAWHNDTFRYTT